MPAVALTDQSNLFAMVKFYKEAQAAGIKPLIGVDAWIREPGERAPPSRIVFLCQNLAGYRHLTQLVTRSYLEGQHRGAPMLERSWMSREALQGLIVLSGGFEGDIGQAIARGRDDEARALSRRAGSPIAATGSISRCSAPAAPVSRCARKRVMELAQTRGVRAVATNDVRFLTRAEFEAHEARVCIHDGAQLGDASRARRYSEEQYLEIAGRDGRAVSGCAGTAGEHALKSPSAVRWRSAWAPPCCRPIPVPAGSRHGGFPARGIPSAAWQARLAAAPARGGRGDGVSRLTKRAWSWNSASSAPWASPATF